MRPLDIPTDQSGSPFLPGEVFETCVSMVKNRNLRARLRAITNDVATQSREYDQSAAAANLFQVAPDQPLSNVTTDEMVKVYTGRMVPKAAIGRAIYDRILSQPPLGRCPLCGVGTVNTLDHFLPKTRFPIFSVTPNNLIPACTWCQGEKDEYFGTSKADQLLHPYFDAFDDETWLGAEVVEDIPAGFRFFAAPPSNWEGVAKRRVQKHMDQLKLGKLFASNAGSRLSEIRKRLHDLWKKGGAAAVKAHLIEELESLEADQKNSWPSAMYRAASSNDWFCQGGFIPE